MTFLITAYDSKEPGTLERRMQIRPRHLENLAQLKQTGTILCAGGIIGKEGHPIGSALIVDLADEEQVRQYLAKEPYVVGGVWKDVTVEAYNVVFQDNEMVGT